MRALLIGSQPPMHLGYTYVAEPPFEAVVTRHNMKQQFSHAQIINMTA